MTAHFESPGDGADPALEFRARSLALKSVLSSFFEFVPVVLYFFLYWRSKDHVRHAVRVGALSFLSLSGTVLWAEVIAELSKSEFARVFVPASSTLRWVLLVLFTLSILALLRYHNHERKHRDAEFLLAERVWEFTIKRGATTWDECISVALPLFFDIFRRLKVRHISVATPDGDFVKIQPQHVYPAETDESFFRALPVGNSVAGRVFQDGKARYLPRLFFPINSDCSGILAARFHHAMVFEIKQTAEGRLDLFRPKLKLNLLAAEGITKFTFTSFISVPLKPIGHTHCIGVMNVDFGSTDPLDRIHIKMATLLGVFLADELERIRRKALPIKGAT